MKVGIVAALALALAGLAGVQDEVDDLIEKLASDDFEVQGKAAKELERLGKAALLAVQKVANDPAAKEQVRAWCRKIGQKIEAGEKRLKELVLKLAGEEVEARDAEDELQKFGRAAVPHLLEAMKSENPEVRKRAVRLLRALDAGKEIESAEEDAGFAEGEVKDGFRFKFRNSTPKQSSASAAAVLSALKWLARHQNRDGSWGGRNFVDQCVGGKCRGGGDPEYDAGVTGLALLAFMGAGHSHLSKAEFPDPVTPGRTLKFGEVVKNGLKWLMAKQDPEGCVGFRGTKYMYNHLIAAVALSEAHGMTGSTLIKGASKKAVVFLLESQNKMAWRYTKESTDCDTSVTGWAIMALRTAEIAGVEPANRDAHKKALRWLDYVTDPELKYRAGYNKPDSGKVFVPGRNDDFKHHEAMTAVNVFCRLFMGRDSSDPALTGTAHLMADLPVWRENYIDFYYWYTGSLAIFHAEGSEGPSWKRWYESVKNAIIPNQRAPKHGCAVGSWSSEEDRWGFEGGQVYATAINALTLETHYRYPHKK